jgi:hypothetical protein
VNTERNPLWRKGNRNTACPYYSECLDDAIKRSWEGWDCCDCKHKLNYENRPWILLTVADSIEY